MVKVEVEKVATLTGHRDCVYTVEKAGRSDRFFSSGGDGMVVSWDLQNPGTGEVIAKTQNSVYALHFVPSREQLLIAENFEGLHVLDLKVKKEVYSPAISTSAIFDIKTCGNRVFAGTGDGHLIVLDLDDYSVLQRIKLSDKSIRSIALRPDGKQLALGASDYSLRILDTASLKVVHQAEAHQNSIFCVVYSPDGKYLLTAGRDAHLKIWDVGSGYILKESIVAHMFAINHIEYSPDGNYFATCSMDKSVKLWDAREFRLLKVIDKSRHTGHGTSVNKLYWSSYNNYLVSGSDDRTISIWNLLMN